MGALARLCVLCGLIGLLHIGRYLAEWLYYQHCASTIYALLFTSGSSTCMGLRSVSTNLTANMAIFAGVILNQMLSSLSNAPASDFSFQILRDLLGRQPPAPQAPTYDAAPHM